MKQPMWAFLIAVLLMVGCSGKPDLRVGDVQGMTIHASGRSWEASAGEVAKIVAAYERADVRHDDNGTTPPVLVDVHLRSGQVMKIWGGSEGLQGVVYQGRDMDLRGVELGELLGKMASEAEQNDPANGAQRIRSDTNRTSVAAGVRP